MTTDYLRLRQVCLVARDAEKAEALLTRILGLSVAYRDERVARYGLCNFILPVGTCFLEVVIPTQPDTAAGRFLDKHHERNGYMAIFDCADLAAVRKRVDRLGIRVLHSRKWPRYENVHLHPRDTGAVMFEFHHNEGGDALDGYYEPAGEDWQRFVRQDRAHALTGIRFYAADPLALAQRWVMLFDKPLLRGEGDALSMALDNVTLHFHKGEGEGHLGAVDLSVHDKAGILADARSLGCVTTDDSVDLCGVRFLLHEA